jgi:uncharacterized Zn-finger protein
MNKKLFLLGLLVVIGKVYGVGISKEETAKALLLLSRKPILKLTHKSYSVSSGKCNICFKEFSHAGNLRRHKKIHTGDRPFGCSYCFKKFSQRSHVSTHEKMHTGEKPFECVLCRIRFRQLVHLEGHLDSNRHRMKKLE